MKIAYFFIVMIAALWVRADEMQLNQQDRYWFDGVVQSDLSFGAIATQPYIMQPHYIRHGTQYLIKALSCLGEPEELHLPWRVLYFGVFASLLLMLLIRHNPPAIVWIVLPVYYFLGWHTFSVLYRHGYADYYGIPILGYLICCLVRNKYLDTLLVLVSLLWIETGVVLAVGLFFLRGDKYTMHMTVALTVAYLLYRGYILDSMAMEFVPSNVWESFIHSYLGGGLNAIPSIADGCLIKYFCWVFGSVCMKVWMFWYFIKYLADTRFHRSLVAMSIACAAISSVNGSCMATYMMQFALPLVLIIPIVRGRSSSHQLAGR